MELDLAEFRKRETGEKSSITDNLSANKFSLIIAALGLVLVLLGLYFVVGSSQNEDKIEIIPAQEENIASKIKADIEGGVMKPGLYELDFGSRLDDLLIMAGGLSADADRGWVEKTFNRAQKLKDGDKFFVPERQKVINQVSTNNSISVADTPVLGTTIVSTININTASLAELDTLYGVGPATAQKIVDNRPYQAVEDLLNKKVVNKSVFGKIQDKISVY